MTKKQPKETLIEMIEETKKYRTHRIVILIIALIIICLEMYHFFDNLDDVLHFLEKYFWVAPIVFFKTTLKRFLLLNFFGILKVILILFGNLLKLVLLKLFNTLGIRYFTFFSQGKWKKLSQRIRILVKKLLKVRKFYAEVLASFGKIELTVVVIAFLPLLLALLLLGFTFKMTREVMVKKGKQIAATKATIKTAKTHSGLVYFIKNIDKKNP